MPRYLGINYFQKALEQRKEFCNHSFLLTPKLLESAELHLQYMSLQPLYERISTTYTDKLTRHENKLKDFLDITVSPKYDKLESSYETRGNGYDDVEVIPSSNPDSPDFCLSEAEIKLEKEIELFEKENLQDMDTLYEKDMLEDVVCINLKYKMKMPTLDHLHGKLQPKHVKDPLCDSQGEVYTEEMIFGNHLNLSKTFGGEAYQEEETFVKISMSEENEDNLEEILSPKTHLSEDLISINYQNILQNSQPDTQSPVKLPIEIYDELSKTDIRTKRALEEGIFDWKLEPKNKEFEDLNNDGKKSRYFEEEFIESPLLCSERLHCDKRFGADFFEKVEYFAMPLLKTKKLLLRDAEEKFLFKALWEKEKYIDEDLYIRVPELTNDHLHSISMMAKVKCNDIPSEKGLGECELKLTWDPFPKALKSEIAVKKWTEKKNMSPTLAPLSMERYEEKFIIRKEENDEWQLHNMLFSNKKHSKRQDRSNTLSDTPSSLTVHNVTSRKRLQPFSSIHIEEMSEKKRRAPSELKNYSPCKDMSAQEKVVFVKDVDLSPSLSPPSPTDNLTYLTSVNNRHMQLSSHCINKSGTELSITNHSDIGRLLQSNASLDEIPNVENKKKSQEQILNDETYPADTSDNTSENNKMNKLFTMDTKQENVQASIFSKKTHFSGKGESISMETNDSLCLFLTMMASNAKEQQQNVNGINGEKGKIKIGSEQNKTPNCVSSKSHSSKTVVANKLICVQFSGPFEEIYREMESYIEPYINLLMQENELPRSFDFKTVTRDNTRFWLKQKEKLLIDEGKYDKEGGKDVCKWLLILHCMKIASEELLHSCLQSAISHLNSFQEKKSSILGSCFNDLRQTLFHHQYRYQTNQTIHPKILAVCREATGLLQTKNAEKWLLVVVLKKPVLSLMTILKDTLAVEGLIKPYIVSENDLWANLRESGSNCFIVSQNKLKDIELSDVACLFEYESSPESILRGICESQAIGFIGFTVKDTQSQFINNNSISSKVSHQDIIKHYQPITVIGSTNLTQHRNILQLLESKYNIFVVERDYSAIKTLNPSSFADIILDQSNAIILKDIQYVSEESNIESVTRQLAAFNLKYQKCWVILSAFETTNGYPLSSEVLSNLFKLEAALANITHRSKLDMAFKVLLCHQKEDMCCMVRAICDMICDNNLHENLERPWLSQTMTKDEKLLLGLPCLNSYSSQLLLKKACLKEIITMSLEDLHRTFPEVPYKVLEASHKVFNDDDGLHLQPSPSRSLHNKTENSFFIKNSLGNEDICSQSETQQSLVPKNINILESEATSARTRSRKNFISPCVKSKQIFEDNFYSGQLLRKKSASEDFLNEHTNSSTSKDIEDNPNQYIMAELEGRQFYNKMSNIPSNEKCSSVDDLNSDNSQDCDYNPVKTLLKPSIYASYSEPELRNLQTKLDKNVLTTDNNNLNKFDGSRPFYARTPRKRLETIERSKPFPRLSQTWSNLSKYGSTVCGQSRQLTPEKRSPSKTCIPVECSQTVKRLQERNAIDISGVSIRDKIQLYENQSNRQASDVKSHYCNMSAPSSTGKLARFSADLTSTTRSLLRRPIVHETLQNHPSHTNLQRVSVGLAQPLQRVQNPKGSDLSLANKQYDVKSQIPSSSEHCRYDQIPNNQRSKFYHSCDHLHYNKSQANSYVTRDRRECMIHGDQMVAGSMTNLTHFPETPHGSGASVHISGENSQSNIKPNKLSFRSIPGRKDGQTVLSFD